MDLLMEAMEKHWDAHDGIPCMREQSTVAGGDDEIYFVQYECLVCNQIIGVSMHKQSEKQDDSDQ